MNSRLGRSVFAALLAMAVLGGSQLLGSRAFWMLFAGIALAMLLGSAVWLAVQRSADLRAWLRERFWSSEEGRYHAFNGVGLRVDDDGRHVWLDGRGLLRALGRVETDEVLAARLTGKWRRDSKGVLMLRVDAVIDYLAHMPERNDPRVQKLRRYLERDVLHPAAERRRRA
jgi:hypothetical protein